MNKKKTRLKDTPKTLPLEPEQPKPEVLPTTEQPPITEVSLAAPVSSEIQPIAIPPLAELLKPAVVRVKDERYPDNNFDLMENNEVGAKAMGGTEMYMRFIYNGGVPRQLLENVQIVPSRLRTLDPKKIRVWFEHNLVGDPESMKALGNEQQRAQFHKIVFLSNWHYQQFMNAGVPYTRHCGVIEGGFEVDDTPFPEKPDPKKQVNIVYPTTPHRGLELIVPVFKHLAETDKNIHLHVHSSFKMYGWDDRDAQFEPLYQQCREHPQITYHGFTEYYKLRELMRDQYHIFAYPCIWAETMCRAALEAIYFGQIAIFPNFAALPDTTGCVSPFMYPGTMDKNQHCQIHAAVLKDAINALRTQPEIIRNILQFGRMYILQRYNTKLVQGKWANLLNELNIQYSTEESRAFPREQFIYRV